jgi:hypothetical protein
MARLSPSPWTSNTGTLIVSASLAGELASRPALPLPITVFR